MKKIIILFIICFFCIWEVFPQIRKINRSRTIDAIENAVIIDSGNVRIWYALNARDIDKQDSYEDLQRLDIGLQLSKYYSFFTFNNDSLFVDWQKKNPNAKGKPHYLGIKHNYSGWCEYHYSEYIKNFGSNVFIEYTRMPAFLEMLNGKCEEQMPVQNWEILEDTLTVTGYLCQKANCRFRGRNYTAWFAVDIPIQNGPWKFGGLPGLILKVYDSDKLYVFECTKIEHFTKKFPITLNHYFNKYKNIEREKLLKYYKKIYEDFFNFAGINLIHEDGSPFIWKKIPYNPLELE
ncbi:MAG: GLPGLI family protein [Prevotellaceae bacterium]|jgi:GLPGLI family protein|nr:GLPGLI family protein [Prevotellaceae bacterium]